MIVVLMFVGLF